MFLSMSSSTWLGAVGSYLLWKPKQAGFLQTAQLMSLNIINPGMLNILLTQG